MTAKLTIKGRVCPTWRLSASFHIADSFRLLGLAATGTSLLQWIGCARMA